MLLKLMIIMKELRSCHHCWITEMTLWFWLRKQI